MFDLALVAVRWPQRANARTFYWLVTRYPPFEWA
jgi:hypothetical protein